jgi:hypothetical protein
MALSLFKRKPKADRPDPADREKAAGAREYNARRHDRFAAEFEKAGDDAGAQAERTAAAEARLPPARVPRSPGR